MKNVSTSLFAALALTSLSAFAAEQQIPSVDPVLEEQVIAEDLVLEGARWLGTSSGYVCDASTASAVTAPTDFAAMNVVFESVVSDFTLDNGLLTATYSADESTSCRYTARFLADNTAKSLSLVESRAWAPAGEGSCAAGKAILDEAFAANEYLYWGHPHHLSVMIPSASAEALCGEGATMVGVDFVLAGKID